MDVVILLKVTGYGRHGSGSFIRGNVAVVTSVISDQTDMESCPLDNHDYFS
jgi:hypothetical protein